MAVFDRGRPSKGLHPPSVAGRYAFRLFGRIVYVGQTDNLRSRLAQHRRGGRFSSCEFEYQVAKPGTTKEDLCRSETARLLRHRPPLNRNLGGGGRRSRA